VSSTLHANPLTASASQPIYDIEFKALRIGAII
jgi:hypothetical protein